MWKAIKNGHNHRLFSEIFDEAHGGLSELLVAKTVLNVGLHFVEPGRTRFAIRLQLDQVKRLFCDNQSRDLARLEE